MGSYFGQDYTAFALMRLAKMTEEELSRSRFSEEFASLRPDRQAVVRDEMRRELQTVDLTQPTVTISDGLAAAILLLRTELARNLRMVDLTTGWTPAHSLDEHEAAQTSSGSAHLAAADSAFTWCRR
jgi:nitric oxide reductase subunit B